MIDSFMSDASQTGNHTLSLHDALPIWPPDHRDAHRRGVGGCHEIAGAARGVGPRDPRLRRPGAEPSGGADRKSTRLNSSHRTSSYAVFCLKKKKTTSPFTTSFASL